MIIETCPLRFMCENLIHPCGLTRNIVDPVHRQLYREPIIWPVIESDDKQSVEDNVGLNLR